MISFSKLNESENGLRIQPGMVVIADGPSVCRVKHVDTGAVLLEPLCPPPTMAQPVLTGFCRELIAVPLVDESPRVSRAEVRRIIDSYFFDSDEDRLEEAVARCDWDVDDRESFTARMRLLHQAEQDDAEDEARLVGRINAAHQSQKQQYPHLGTAMLAGAMVDALRLTADDRYACPCCGKPYAVRANLKKHLISAHAIESDEADRLAFLVHDTIGEGD